MSQPNRTHTSPATAASKSRWLWPAVAGGAFAAGLAMPRPWGDGSANTGPDETARATGPVVVAPGDTGPQTTSEAIAANAKRERESAGADGARPLAGWRLEQLAEEAFRDPSALKRSLAFAKLLEGLTPENASQIFDTLKEMGAGREQWDLFRYAWASKDGEAAIAFGESLEGREREWFLNSAVAGWASADPEAAIAWTEAIEDEEQRARAIGSLVGGIADSDVDRATDYVLKLAQEGNRNADRYMDSVVSEKLRGGDVIAAASWAETLPDGSLKGVALDRVAGRYTDENPEAAAAWASQYATADFGARVIEEVADEWAERNPESAVAWLDSLPEGDARAEGLQSALNEWTERDPLAASQYLTTMAPSPTRDRAVNGFVGELADSDPMSAVVWAETIQQDEMRVRALTRAAREWYQRDADAAADWLIASGLPEDAQAAVVAPRRGRGRR